MSQAFIGLGSNLDNPLEQLERAIDELNQESIGKVVKVSPFYRTKPVGYLDQPDFVNAVLELHTDLLPQALLAHFKKIELTHGRQRLFQNGPRTLDLDLLAYDQQRIHDADLIVPHPRIQDRAFVLIPFNDIAPNFIIPGVGKVSELALQCQHNDVIPMEQPS